MSGGLDKARRSLRPTILRASRVSRKLWAFQLSTFDLQDYVPFELHTKPSSYLSHCCRAPGPRPVIVGRVEAGIADVTYFQRPVQPRGALQQCRLSGLETFLANKSHL